MCKEKIIRFILHQLWIILVTCIYINKKNLFFELIFEIKKAHNIYCEFLNFKRNDMWVLFDEDEIIK